MRGVAPSISWEKVIFRTLQWYLGGVTVTYTRMPRVWSLTFLNLPHPHHIFDAVEKVTGSLLETVMCTLVHNMGPTTSDHESWNYEISFPCPKTTKLPLSHQFHPFPLTAIPVIFTNHSGSYLSLQSYHIPYKNETLLVFSL